MASKLAKSAIMSQINSFIAKLQYEFDKTQNSMLISNPLKRKNAKMFPQKISRLTTFTHSNESKKLNFPITFLLITFCNFFNGFEVSIKFAFFYTDIEFLQQKFFVSLSKCTKRLKKTKHCYYKILQP